MAGPMLSDRARSFPTRQKDMNYDGGTARRCLRWRGTGMVSECHWPMQVKDLRTGGDVIFLFSKRIFCLSRSHLAKNRCFGKILL